MEQELLEMAVTQGIWAVLSIALIFYILKNQEKRDNKQEEREANYQNIIQTLNDKLNIVNNIKEDVEDIKTLIKEKK